MDVVSPGGALFPAPAEEALTSYRQLMTQGLPKDEKGLAALVVKQLQLEGWEVYQEVAFGKLLDRSARQRLEGRKVPWGAVCDIVAVRGPLMMAVEVKKSFSLDLVEQCISWTRLFPLVSMAVPSVNLRSGHDGVRWHLRDYFGLGICSISRDYTGWHVPPRLLRHNLAMVSELAQVLIPAMATISEAGAVHTYRHTPYQQTMDTVRWLLAWKGPMRMRDIIAYLGEHGAYHWSSPASMKSGLSAAINKNEPDFENSGRLVAWVPERCPHGKSYVEDVLKRANGRKKAEEGGL